MAAVKRYNDVQLDGKPMKIEIMETNVATPAAPPATKGTFGNSKAIPRGYAPSDKFMNCFVHKLYFNGDDFFGRLPVLDRTLSQISGANIEKFLWLWLCLCLLCFWYMLACDDY